MIPLAFSSGKTFAVFGMARSGLAAARALEQSGARVVCADDGEAGQSAAQSAGFDVVPHDALDVTALAAVILSPGVPFTHPEPHPLVARAQAAHCPVIGDIELFAQARAALPAHRLVGITGTNGKSTTTALIHHVLVQAGIAARLGGNIGLPVLELEPLPAGGVYVFELSSYQLDLSFTLDCDVAVITNMTPDHLDRHGDMAGYAKAKQRLFDQQRGDGAAIIGQDDDWCRAMGETVHGRLRAISSTHVLCAGISVVGGALRINGDARALQSDWPALQGPHNGQNAAAAYAACLSLGVPHDKILEGFASFAGLPHRMERIGSKRGVLYVNDSKATNADSTAPALAAYPALHWILGGRRKSDDLDACVPHLAQVRAAYTIGESAQHFARLLSAHVPVTVSGLLEQAVQDAAAQAKPGDVVLLSPACASQDQFRDFEHRGEVFRTCVAALEDA